MISAPLASKLARMTSKSGYFPVPSINRERNVREPTMNRSIAMPPFCTIKAFCSVPSKPSVGSPIVPSAEPQNLLGNGRIWGHPKPRQGGFAKCHPQSLPPLVFLQLEAGTHCIIFVLIATLKVRARPHEVLPVVSLYEIDTQSAPETSLLRQTWIQHRPNQK